MTNRVGGKPIETNRRRFLGRNLIIGFETEYIIGLDKCALISDLHRNAENSCSRLGPIVTITIFVNEGNFALLLNSTVVAESGINLGSPWWRGLWNWRLEAGTSWEGEEQYHERLVE
jgi:hypothetical protein